MNGMRKYFQGSSRELMWNVHESCQISSKTFWNFDEIWQLYYVRGRKAYLYVQNFFSTSITIFGSLWWEVTGQMPISMFRR